MKKIVCMILLAVSLSACKGYDSAAFKKSRSYTYSQCASAHGTWWSRTGQCVDVPKEKHG